MIVIGKLFPYPDLWVFRSKSQGIEPSVRQPCIINTCIHEDYPFHVTQLVPRLLSYVVRIPIPIILLSSYPPIVVAENPEQPPTKKRRRALQGTSRQGKSKAF